MGYKDYIISNTFCTYVFVVHRELFSLSLQEKVTKSEITLKILKVSLKKRSLLKVKK